MVKDKILEITEILGADPSLRDIFADRPPALPCEYEHYLGHPRCEFPGVSNVETGGVVGPGNPSGRDFIREQTASAAGIRIPRSVARQDLIQFGRIEGLLLDQPLGDPFEGLPALLENGPARAWDSSRIRRTSRSISRAVCSLQA